MKKQEKAITLIALIITIVILIILAAITVIALTGDNGIFARAKQAKQDTLNAQKYEENQIAKYNDDITNMIDENNINQEEPSIEKFLSYKVKKNDVSQISGSTLLDNTGKGNNATLYNTSIINDGKELYFNGSDSYATVLFTRQLQFPLTMEIKMRMSESKDGIVFIEPNTKIAFGTYSSYFCLSSCDYSTNTVTVPNDFYNGELKHIFVVYRTLHDFDMYVDGTLLNKNNFTDQWNYSGSTIYLGKRSSGTNFKGSLSEFNIYEKTLSLDEMNQLIQYERNQ